jgi:alanine-glyoxylate transaminase/serine-glyoxylate transaminase/serine-pyruvate transaminase
MIPGPTNLSEAVREAMSRPQVGHASPIFYEAFKDILQLARYVFRNEKGAQLVFSGSGTIGMESTVVSLVSHGDRTLTLDTGYFGKRFLMLNQVHGAQADVIEYPVGTHADPDDLRKKLRSHKYRAVFMTLVDTGSTVKNPFDDLVAECSSAGVFSVVDGVSSVGGVEVEFDKLGADVLFTASQKALAAPPGAVLLALSPEILEYFEKRKEPIESYYMNLLRWKNVMDDPKIYLATPSVQVMLALRQALVELKEEGLQNRWRRHKKLAESFRNTMSEAGVELVANKGAEAETVSGFWVKEGLAPEIQRMMREKHNVEVARGLYDNNTKMIRVGHFGILSLETMRMVNQAMSEVLEELGVSSGPRTAPRVARSA